MLGSNNNDLQLQKRHKMLCRELSSLDWNGCVVLRCLRSFCCHAHCQFENFRVLDGFGLDWTRQNLDLWDRVRAVLMSAVMSLHWFSFLLHDMSMGFIRVETTVICFAVM